MQSILNYSVSYSDQLTLKETEIEPVSLSLSRRRLLIRSFIQIRIIAFRFLKLVLNLKLSVMSGIRTKSRYLSLPRRMGNNYENSFSYHSNIWSRNWEQPLSPQIPPKTPLSFVWLSFWSFSCIDNEWKCRVMFSYPGRTTASSPNQNGTTETKHEYHTGGSYCHSHCVDYRFTCCRTSTYLYLSNFNIPLSPYWFILEISSQRSFD